MILSEQNTYSPVLAVGPTFRGDRDPCLDCFLRRRNASPAPLGPISLAPTIAASREDVRDHQVLLGPERRGTHRLWPFPECHCARARDLLSGSVRIPFDEVVSERSGLISSINSRNAGNYIEVTTFSARTIGTGGVPVVADGSGSDVSPALAALRAIAESMERYSAGFWGYSRTTSVVNAEDPGSVMANSVVDDSPVMVPAPSVFIPYPLSTAVQDSVGLAAGRNLAAAQSRALAERIERDTFWDALADRQSAAQVEQVADGLLQCDFTGLLSHHVIILLRYSPAQRPFLTLGLGCSTNVAHATEKAHMEESHVRASVSGALGESLSSGRSRLDRLLWSCANDRTAAAMTVRTLASNGPNTQPGSREYASLEITVPEARALGLHVVRVVRLRQ
jgi:YcaO cyclodehydratase, ATP-ad Mg2+-binding